MTEQINGEARSDAGLTARLSTPVLLHDIRSGVARLEVSRSVSTGSARISYLWTVSGPGPDGWREEESGRLLAYLDDHDALRRALKRGKAALRSLCDRIEVGEA